ncbi:hypothetical protein Glove_21g202 [Diversispora epigaea]|uniref:Uncharacterized protein n=1 Tax=Diversispora epigaea TaxID=1348612 RepID=A0A397JK82_9GLOM|nr:hypothetical protein Glove_21g202 [Diversispora epigaea]
MYLKDSFTRSKKDPELSRKEFFIHRQTRSMSLHGGRNDGGLERWYEDSSAENVWRENDEV